MRNLLCAILGLCATTAQAQSEFVDKDPAVLLNYGVNCQFEAVGYLKGADTIDGEIVETRRRYGVAYEVVTRRVPLRTGLGFGFVYRLDPSAATRTNVITLTHPPMGPEGRTVQTWTSVSVGGGVEMSEGYLLEDDFELVPGDWVFRVYDSQQMLLKVPFVLVPENEDVSRRCDTRRAY